MSIEDVIIYNEELENKIKELEVENKKLKEELENTPEEKIPKFTLLDVKTPERLKKKLNELVDYINKE